MCSVVPGDSTVDLGIDTSAFSRREVVVSPAMGAAETNAEGA
jgi:hypothetical protein